MSAWETRRDRRAAAREVTRHEPKSHDDDAAERRSRRIRQGVFGLVVAVVLAVGGYLAFGDLAGPRGAATRVGASRRLVWYTPREYQARTT